MPHHSAGVTPGNFQKLTGQRFGRLVVKERSSNGPKGMARWVCHCDCGNMRVVRGSHLLQGKILSCGCLGAERRRASRVIHGLNETPEHIVWMRMIGRCTNPKDHRFAYYGGRGVYVCERWLGSFPAFLADMGERPSPRHSIDRKDNSGSYTCGLCDQCRDRNQPANCRWATLTEQARNKRNNRLITFQGETLPLAQWAERTGIKRETIARRLNDGWSEERALTELP